EIAAVSSIFKGKKAIYLVPLKAIAEEKYADFRAKYSSLGIKIAISTRDRRGYDPDLEKGDFDLGILIYEKFNQLLLKNLDILKNIDLLIIDELQMIGDYSRGQVLELALIKTLLSGYKPQIIGFSAVLGEVERLASWLGCKLIMEKKRPVELFQGILYKGKYIYKGYNSQEEGEEEFAEVESEKSEELLFPNIQRLLNEGEQVLVFLKSRNETVKMALLFSEKLEGKPAVEALEKLEELEDTSLKRKLLQCMQKGVAFHNADLSCEERKIVESSYLEKETNLIFATSTLSLGVNLPTRTVFIESLKYESGEFTDKGILVPLTWSEYENMSGRAGRFGLEDEFGRSVLLAGNQFHFDSLWERYVEGKEEKLAPVLDRTDLEDIVLDLVSSGLAQDYSRLEKILRSSFSAERLSKEKDIIKNKIEKLTENRVLISDEKGNLSATTLGKTISLQGIKIKTGLAILRKLEKEAASVTFNPTLDLLDWFYELLKTPDGRKIYVPLTYYEIEKRIYQTKLKEKSRQIPFKEELKKFLANPVHLTSKELSRLKLTLLFCDWLTPITVLDLENEYFVRSGFISQTAGELAWLLDSSAAIARISDAGTNLEKNLKELSLQVLFGIDKDMVELAKLKLPGLGRDYLWKLSRKGINSKKRIEEMDIEELKKIIPEKIALRLKEVIKLIEKDHKGRGLLQYTPTSDVRRKGFFISRLVLDGSLIKGKYTVIINGRRILLSCKSFKYLFKLVWAIYNKEGGWIHKLDLEEGENQGKYIYRLKKELSDSEKLLIENNRVGCYRLNLKKEQIQLNLKALENFQDFEIEQLLNELKPIDSISLI
ncbi:MAG: helicase-related protein, partial [candidate division Zixibacteria bacterium]|nr:helicase-related protein [candidate division Zixibacteria bacterium]